MDTDIFTELAERIARPGDFPPCCDNPPADPKWKQHKWQSYHESRQEYVKHLLDNIADCKKFIASCDDFAKRHIEISDDTLMILKTEKEILLEYQEELRKVVQS